MHHATSPLLKVTQTFIAKSCKNKFILVASFKLSTDYVVRGGFWVDNESLAVDVPKVDGNDPVRGSVR